MGLVNHAEQRMPPCCWLPRPTLQPAAATEQLKRRTGSAHFDDVLVASAPEDFNIQAFTVCVEHLPEGPMWFPEDMETDALPEDLVVEFVREKLLLNLRQEVPIPLPLLVILRGRNGWTSLFLCHHFG